VRYNSASTSSVGGNRPIAELVAWSNLWVKEVWRISWINVEKHLTLSSDHRNFIYLSYRKCGSPNPMAVS